MIDKPKWIGQIGQSPSSRASFNSHEAPLPYERAERVRRHLVNDRHCQRDPVRNQDCLIALHQHSIHSRPNGRRRFDQLGSIVEANTPTDKDHHGFPARRYLLDVNHDAADRAITVRRTSSAGDNRQAAGVGRRLGEQVNLGANRVQRRDAGNIEDQATTA